MKRLPTAPFWWRKLRARAGHWFWLPCPICGEYFSGREWLTSYLDDCSIVVIGDKSTRRGICPWCTLSGNGRHYAYNPITEQAEAL